MTAAPEWVPRIRKAADMDLAARRRGVAALDAELQATVQRIVSAVKDGGDDALRACTEELDGCDLSDPWLSEKEWKRLARACPVEVRDAMRGNLARIRRFHKMQVGKETLLDRGDGLVLGRRPVPYRAVACYVPGGRASYPSTVLMTVIPAHLAGVQDIIVVTPPRADGRIDPAVAFAARMAGATRILRAGGAQAVAALAFGTADIAPVQAIVGPGNHYVTAAKRMVADAGAVWTDAPAGPSELLVLADDTANPAWVAADLIAQAEHDPDAQVVLVTDMMDVAKAVQREVGSRFLSVERGNIVRSSLRDHGLFVVTDTWTEAIRFVNDYAPEHLEIMSANPRTDLSRIRNAGSVFLGPYAPVSIGDYGSGTNHVLPTMGQARIRGGLSVDDFRKWMTWQEATPEGLAAIADDITMLARAEGLEAHAEAVEARTQ